MKSIYISKLMRDTGFIFFVILSLCIIINIRTNSANSSNSELIEASNPNQTNILQINNEVIKLNFIEAESGIEFSILSLNDKTVQDLKNEIFKKKAYEKYKIRLIYSKELPNSMKLRDIQLKSIDDVIYIELNENITLNVDLQDTDGNINTHDYSVSLLKTVENIKKLVMPSNADYIELIYKDNTLLNKDSITYKFDEDNVSLKAIQHRCKLIDLTIEVKEDSKDSTFVSLEIEVDSFLTDLQDKLVKILNKADTSLRKVHLILSKQVNSSQINEFPLLRIPIKTVITMEEANSIKARIVRDNSSKVQVQFNEKLYDLDFTQTMTVYQFKRELMDVLEAEGIVHDKYITLKFKGQILDNEQSLIKSYVLENDGSVIVLESSGAQYTIYAEYLGNKSLKERQIEIQINKGASLFELIRRIEALLDIPKSISTVVKTESQVILTNKASSLEKLGIQDKQKLFVY